MQKINIGMFFVNNWRNFQQFLHTVQMPEFRTLCNINNKKESFWGFSPQPQNVPPSSIAVGGRRVIWGATGQLSRQASRAA
jgi:hypothetical protein